MRYGFVDVERHQTIRREHGIFLHVLVAGVDVTDRCKSFDDVRGRAYLYRLDAEGRRYLDKETGEVAMEAGVAIREERV